MNLYKIGDMTLNMDRVNGIQDHFPATDPGAPAGHTVIRVLFDDAHIDLSGTDAQVLRRWIRHSARNLAPRKSEDGDDLIAPEEQLHRLTEHLISLIDRVRPRDAALRGAAHRLANLIDEYITGQLQPVRAQAFERHVPAGDTETPAFPETSA